jgi:hypothetical protein
LRKVSISPKTDAVSARVRGVEDEKLALACGKDLVDAVAEFVGKRHHVAWFAEVVQHDVRMDGR